MNFICSTQPQSDRDLFFGPLDGSETFHILPPERFTPADFAVVLGIFSSRNIASKNGWSKERLPPGFGTKQAKVKKVPTTIAWLNTFNDAPPNS